MSIDIAKHILEGEFAKRNRTGIRWTMDLLPSDPIAIAVVASDKGRSAYSQHRVWSDTVQHMAFLSEFLDRMEAEARAHLTT